MAGTSLNDLVRASGLTKGAFYCHFYSKEELALQALDALIDDGRTDGSVAADAATDAWTLLAALIGMDALSELMSGGRDLAERNEHLVAFLRRALAPAAASRAPSRRTESALRSRRGPGSRWAPPG